MIKVFEDFISKENEENFPVFSARYDETESYVIPDFLSESTCFKI